MAIERDVVEAAGAPAAVGPYSHAIRAGELLFCSGQIPLDPSSGRLVGQAPGEQCAQCLRNLAAVCEAAGTDLGRAIRLTVYTTDLDRFDQINEAYATFFEADPPARVAVGVPALPKGALVEISGIVALP